MKCPHCLTDFHDNRYDQLLNWQGNRLTEGDQTVWTVRNRLCPSCGKAIIALIRAVLTSVGHRSQPEILVWPKGIARAPLPSEVPDPFASDYREACNVLADSPKASAALSRRCLQALLRDVAKVKPSDLAKEIQEVLDSKMLPSHLAEAIDAVRQIGNFAAHPIKSTNTGAILDVEPGEAEWLLDTLEELFDFYFVQPAILARKRDALNAKLAAANKPPLR